MGRGVPSLVLVRRDAAQRGDPGRRPIRHPRGIRVQIRSPDCWRAREARHAALRRRAGRRADGPIGPAVPQRGRAPGRVPRRRPEPRRRDRRRAPRLRRPRGPGPGRRGDGRQGPPHHDARRARKRGPARPRGRLGPGPRCPHRPVRDRAPRRERERQPGPPHPCRGPPQAADDHGALQRRRRDHPRPHGPHHRGRRVDRIRARPPGVRARTAPPRPRGPGREPPVPRRARSRDAAPPGSREAARSASTSRTSRAGRRWSA